MRPRDIGSRVVVDTCIYCTRNKFDGVGAGSRMRRLTDDSLDRSLSGSVTEFYLCFVGHLGKAIEAMCSIDAKAMTTQHAYCHNRENT